MREGKIARKTNETDISLYINLDGTGLCEINTGCGFFDHMLNLFAKHSHFDFKVNCNGDTDVDFHHSAEDIGICLGKAFKEAVGDMKGIKRYADTVLPMDEALILSAVDISGRNYLGYDLDIPALKLGDFDTELTEEFFIAFVNNANITLHIKQLSGRNSHHIIEGTFKSVARTLAAATQIDKQFENVIPSTKGVL